MHILELKYSSMDTVHVVGGFLLIFKCLCSWEVGVSLLQDLFLVHFRLNLADLHS